MKYKIAELNQEFSSQKEMFKALVDNKDRILSIKRKQIIIDKTITTNVINGSTIKSLESGYVYPIISVTNLYDSHKDVHFKGSMTKTVKEQQGKVVYALDHLLEVEKILAWEDELEMQLMNLKMQDLGYGSDQRELEALAFKIKEDVLLNCGKKSVVNIIEKRKPITNSIRMLYFKVRIGINDSDEEFKENYEYYNSRIDEIYNKEDVEKNGYFYGIEELGIKDEGSMVVRPSQSAAITLYGNQNEPSIDTQTEIKEAVSNTSATNYFFNPNLI